VRIVPGFGTLEWYQEYKKMWDADESIIKLLKGFSTTMISKISDRPELKPIYQKIEDGRLVEIRYAEPDEKAEFYNEAPMEVYKGITEGTINPLKATMTGQLKQKGPQLKLIRYMKGMSRTAALQKGIPTEW
jgi:putative sterol carrier protein